MNKFKSIALLLTIVTGTSLTFAAFPFGGNNSSGQSTPDITAECTHNDVVYRVAVNGNSCPLDHNSINFIDQLSINYHHTHGELQYPTSSSFIMTESEIAEKLLHNSEECILGHKLFSD